MLVLICAPVVQKVIVTPFIYMYIHITIRVRMSYSILDIFWASQNYIVQCDR